MYRCLDERRSFRLEAGAGAGKTYSLVKALQYLIDRDKRELMRRHQQIACITFTNVARDEIIARTDRSPSVFCETNHAFCWSLIRGFQKLLRQQIVQMDAWAEKSEEVGGDLGERAVEYNLGHRSISEDRVTLHHNDVLPLTVALMSQPKFTRILADRHPIILVDEYQDTDDGWMDGIKRFLLGHDGAPLFGFFGDHWQKIYGTGCGSIEHASITEIGKEANFRSDAMVVECLNRMRPDLTQEVKDPESTGQVSVFHSNNWSGERRGGAQWKGDLPEDDARQAFERVKAKLIAQDWDFTPEHTKVLMLTHRLLASEQGYSSLPRVFKYNESFAKKEHPHIEFLVDRLEPACDAFTEKRYGAMFDVLGGSAPLIRSIADKLPWHEAMESVVRHRVDGTVGAVIDHLRTIKKPRLPDTVERRERELSKFDEKEQGEMPRVLNELKALRDVPYAEIIALRRYLHGHSPFETKHGVKGAEFENVFAIFGRGWNVYNFNTMLEMAGSGTIPNGKERFFEQNRNLFYVVCSRPKRRLAILFTQELSDVALATLSGWFLPENIHEVEFG